MSHDRWVINKIRALATYYTKGFEHGSHLRTAINRVNAIGELRDLIGLFFSAPVPALSALASGRPARARPANVQRPFAPGPAFRQKRHQPRA